jgi:hypothetical protein
MNHVHDTWYVLEDGAKANPNDVVADDKGALRHKDGRAVAMRGSVPRTSGVGPAVDETKAAPAAKDRELKAGADDGKGYRTRGRPNT